MSELNELNCGDCALIYVGGFARSYRKVVIEHATPTQLVAGGLRFRRKDGNIVGANSWIRTYLKPYDDEEWQAWLLVKREKDMRYALRVTNWDRVPKATLEAMYALLPKKESATAE